jgi:hypothetical protein
MVASPAPEPPFCLDDRLRLIGLTLTLESLVVGDFGPDVGLN